MPLIVLRFSAQPLRHAFIESSPIESATLQKFLKIIAAIAILIAVPKVIQKIMFGETKLDISKQMTSMVDEINKDLPKKIDATTTASKVEFDGITYRVHYSMDPGINLDQSNKALFKSFAMKQICGGKMKGILEKGVAIEYMYTFNPDGGADREMNVLIPTDSCK